jgi:Domain of unknown function (DUF6531)
VSGGNSSFDSMQSVKVAKGDPVVEEGEPVGRTVRVAFPKNPLKAPKTPSSKVSAGATSGPGSPGTQLPLDVSTGIASSISPMFTPQMTDQTIAAKKAKFKPGSWKLIPIGESSDVVPILQSSGAGSLEAQLNSEAKVVLTESTAPSGAVQLRYKNFTVGLRPLGGKAVKPAKQNNTKSSVRWTGAMSDGSDLVETVTGSGAKGEIVLAVPPKKEPVWNFELTLSPGLSPVSGDGYEVGASRSYGVPINILNESNVQVAQIPAGVAIDAKGVKTVVDLVLRKAKDERRVVQVAVERDWLLSGDRAYPVRVDPGVSLYISESSIVTLDSAGSPPSYGAPFLVRKNFAGFQSPVPPNRTAYVKVTLPALGGQSNIDYAQLSIDVTHCDSYDDAAVSVAATNSAWNPATLNLSNVPSIDPGTFRLKDVTGDVVSFDVTGAVKYWAAGNGAGTQGFAVTTSDYTSCTLAEDHLIGLGVHTIDAVTNGAPALLSSVPANNASGVVPGSPISVVASDPENDSLSYSFQMCVPAFTVSTTCYSSLVSNLATWTPPVLPFLQQAEWRVVLSDGLNSYSSPIRTFTTRGPNGAPTVIQVSPSSQAGGIGAYSGGTSTATMTASAVDPNGDPVEYLFYVYTYPGWAYLTNSPWQASSTFSVPLQPGTGYAWYVYARDVPPSNSQASLQAGASAWWYFTTAKRPNVGPSVPSMLSVANGAVNQSGTPTLSAQSTDPEGDTVQYQYTACPVSGGCVTSPWVSGAWTVSPTLSYNTAYTWSAKARDVPPATSQAGITSAQSASWGFTTGANPSNAIQPPQALFPADGANTTTRPLLEINATDGDGDGIEYAFQICSPNFPGVAVSPQCFSSPWVATRYWQPPVDLTWGAQYKWRAYARNTSDVLNTVGLAGAWTRTLTPGTPALNSNGQLAGGYGPNIDIDGGDDGAVNEGLGTFVTSAQDAKVASAGPSLSIDRTYNANSRKQGYFGTAWSSNLEIRLTVIPGRYVYLQDTWGQAATTANPPVAITFGDGGERILLTRPSSCSDEHWVSGFEDWYVRGSCQEPGSGEWSDVVGLALRDS